MIQKAQKKPVVIEFIQFNGNSNTEEICKWIGKDLKTEIFSDIDLEAGTGPLLFSLFIPTLEGVMRAENEIKIACKRENPNWDGKSLRYFRNQSKNYSGLICSSSAFQRLSTT